MPPTPRSSTLPSTASSPSTRTVAVQEFNRAAEATFGYRRAEVLGRNIAELIVPPHLRERMRKACAAISRRVSAICSAGASRSRRMRADGSIFPVELAIAEVRLRSTDGCSRPICATSASGVACRAALAESERAAPRDRRGPDRADLPLRCRLPPDLLQPSPCAAVRRRARSPRWAPICLPRSLTDFGEELRSEPAGADPGPSRAYAREREDTCQRRDPLVRLDQPGVVRRRRTAASATRLSAATSPRPSWPSKRCARARRASSLLPRASPTGWSSSIATTASSTSTAGTASSCRRCCRPGLAHRHPVRGLDPRRHRTRSGLPRRHGARTTPAGGSPPAPGTAPSASTSMPMAAGCAFARARCPMAAGSCSPSTITARLETEQALRRSEARLPPSCSMPRSGMYLKDLERPLPHGQSGDGQGP